MNPFQQIVQNGTEIAAAFIGLAALGLLLVNSSGAANVAQGVGSAFSGVLATATFQNTGLRSNVGNVFNSL